MDIKTHAVFTFAVNLDFRELEVMADLFNTATTFHGHFEPDGHAEDDLIERIKGLPEVELHEIGGTIAEAFANAVDAITHCEIDEP